jgi:hypothetical protein
VFATEEVPRVQVDGILNIANPWISRLLADKVVDDHLPALAVQFQKTQAGMQNPSLIGPIERLVGKWFLYQ